MQVSSQSSRTGGVGAGCRDHQRVSDTADNSPLGAAFAGMLGIRVYATIDHLKHVVIEKQVYRPKMTRADPSVQWRRFPLPNSGMVDPREMAVLEGITAWMGVNRKRSIPLAHGKFSAPVRDPS